MFYFSKLRQRKEMNKHYHLHSYRKNQIYIRNVYFKQVKIIIRNVCRKFDRRRTNLNAAEDLCPIFVAFVETLTRGSIFDLFFSAPRFLGAIRTRGFILPCTRIWSGLPRHFPKLLRTGGGGGPFRSGALLGITSSSSSLVRSISCSIGFETA